MKLLLFDLDGTLLRAGGIGRRSTRIALEEVFGRAGNLDRIYPGGRTQEAIFLDTLLDMGYDQWDFDQARDQLYAVFLDHFRKGIAAGDHGIEPLPGAVKWTFAPFTDVIVETDIPPILDEMEEQGMVLVYGEKRQFGQLLNWWDYQKPRWARPSKWPPPDGWTDRVNIRVGGKVVTEGWGTDGGYCTSSADGSPPTEIRHSDSDSDSDRKGVKRDTRLDHPAIVGYRELARLHVPIPMRDDWIACSEEVGVDELLAFTKEWIGNGWNKQNVNGIMEYARNGGEFKQPKKKPSPYVEAAAREQERLAKRHA